MTNSSSSRRFQTIHSIQLLRAVAALIVAVYHAHHAFSARSPSPVDQQESYLFGLGPVGVHIFFVISGFIMVYVTSPKSFTLAKFLQRRIYRIYPIYWICAALYLTYHASVGPPYALSQSALIGSLLLAPGHSAGIIGPAWTLSYELFFYLSFGLAMTLGRDRGLLALFAVFGTLIVAGVLLNPGQPFWQVTTNPLLLEFLSGTAIGWFYLQGYLHRRIGWFSVGASLLLFGIGYAYGYEDGPSVVIWGVPSALLVLGLVTIECHSTIPSSLQRLAVLGDSSYALYLIHILVITIAIDLANVANLFLVIHPVAAALALGFASLLAGEFLHRLVERPLLARLKPKRRVPTPA